MNFAQFAGSYGLIIHDIYPGTKIKRCPTELHPRSDNGAYFFDGDRGWVMAWDGDGRVHWWNDTNAKAWTDAEKREWATRKRQDEIKREAGYRRAAEAADAALRACKPAQHNYLRSKNLPDTLGLVNDAHELMVAMRSVDTNHLVGLQVIKFLTDERVWQKKMLPGMKAKGAVLRLGPSFASETWLCEGYATGLTIEAAIRRLNLNASVLICFSDRNMVHVAPMVKGKKFIFADHDASGAGERAAVDTGLPYCMSPNLGEDANDLYARAGLMAVCKLIMDTRLDRVVSQQGGAHASA